MKINLVNNILSTLKFQFPYSPEDFANHLYFENYHCHKDFSNVIIADSGEPIENYAKRSLELGAKCLFSGEHGTQGNQFHVYNVAEKNKLRYRHSTEAYWVKDRFEKDRTNCHMIIVAKNAEGRKDINFALSMANIDGYYYRPRIDLDLLFKIPKDNVIVTSACFTKDMMVYTKNGYKKITDVKIDDYVFNYLGNWERVSEVVCNDYNDDLYEFKIEGCAEIIECTKDHLFPTIQKNHNDVIKNIIWKKAEELTTKDRILEAINTEFDEIENVDFTNVIDRRIISNVGRRRKHVKNKVIELNNEFLELIGIYTAEGNLCNSNKDGIDFTLNLKDKLICDKTVKYIREIFGIEPYIQIREESQRMDIRVSSTEVYEIFNSFVNNGAMNKDVPTFVLKLPPKKQMQFIKGLFNGDGHLNKSEPKITWKTVSKQLYLHVVDILERNDIKVSAYTTEEYIDKNNVHHNKAYIVNINNSGFREYWETFRITNNDYMFDWMLNVKWNSKKPIIINGVKYQHKRVIKISKRNYSGKVYCINVNNGHSFKLETISVHNCVAGWLYEDADDIWLKIHEYFGDNFFFEVQANITDPQKRLNERILNLAAKHGIEIIAGLDSHYINEVGQVKRDQILRYKKVSYPEEEGWFMDYPDGETLARRFQEQGVLSEEQILRAIMNTNIFVDECEEIVFDRSFKIPSLYKDKTYEEKCKIFKNELNKAYKKEKVKSKEKAEGIRYEASQIMDSGVVDYFLTSQAIVKDAVENEGGILTTTARGSASSFIINKLLGLTTIDRTISEVPMIPERFLTKERVQAGMMPDIDLNIATQEPFVRATKKIVGEEGCYPLMAIEKLQTKAAWQLYAGVNDVKPSDANQISKYIEEYEKKLKHADEEEKEDISVEDFIPNEYIQLFRQSNDYQGIAINLKVHSCGHILFDGDVRREIGLISATSKSNGKRTLCACVEGKVLDDFGLVKEDYLIVDSVSLTYEFFQSINKPVPSFEELKEMVKDDKATWDIYAKGITCCVNQCEKEATIQKLIKYKPKNPAELSAFIAAIRPGFSSLLSVFLNREHYSTGEKEIDNILSSSAHFMLYQEGIMSVLNYLGMEMGDTYKVIKNISKKKYRDHPEELKILKDKLIKSWEEKIGNTNNFDNVWNVIESSALYAFNSSHSAAMMGDSLYQAWFKAHYTKNFYEVAIDHYQRKGKKDKIDALVKEALAFYGYKLGGYKFGDDNRRININEEKHIIYPNMSSLKDFGDWVGEVMYELGQNHYDNFIDLYRDMCKNSMNKTIINKLIRINYFEQFGSARKLQKMIELYNQFYDMKQILKTKAESLGVPFELLHKYGHETEKQFNRIDGPSLYEELCSRIEDKPLTYKEVLLNELDVYGIVKSVFEDVSHREYLIIELDVNKKVINLKAYEIFSGAAREIKMWTSSYEKNPFAEGQFMSIQKIKKCPKKEPTGEVDSKGKKIYQEIPDQYEYWLQSYYIIEE